MQPACLPSLDEVLVETSCTEMPPTILITYRNGILRCYTLKTTDLDSVEAAYECAHMYVAQQRADWPQAVKDHYPDRLLPGCPAGDLFYFTDYKGKGPHMHSCM